MPVGWKPKRVHKVIAGKEGITIQGGRTMNNTKWNEIFRSFYYNNELIKDAPLIMWRTRDIETGCLSNWDGTWTHFGCEPRDWDKIEYLQIQLTPENKTYVMECLKRIHVPGTVENGVATVYGYRTDVDYI